MKKLLHKIICIAIVMASVMTVIGGCAKPSPNTPDDLEIYVWDAGYGTDWLKSLIADFKEQEWVKAKYPNLRILDPVINTQGDYAASRISAGAAANSIDLFFGQNLFNMYGSADTNGVTILEDLTDIYKANVEGEDITLEDKMLENFLHRVDDKYYGVPWVAGMNGILYNKTIVEDEMGMAVPLTTDQLVKFADTVKSWGGKNEKYKPTYTFMSSTKTGYWTYMLNVWWAQYEGYENYNNFFEGIHDNARSKEIFRQIGRRESLKVMEKLIRSDNGYMYEGASALEFMESQDRLLMGDGLMQVNGDWYYDEMKTNAANFKKLGYDYEISFMKTPIVSSIVNRAFTIVDLAEATNKPVDDVLAEVVAAIDRGETSFEGVRQAHFDIVAEARTIVDSIGYNHMAVIPSYAIAKEPAKDFLRYMATDRGNKVFIDSTRGSNLPFKYDVKTIEPELYEGLPSLQKAKIDVYNNKTFPVNVLPSPSKFPLVYYGNLSAISSVSGNLESVFFSAKAGKGQELYDNDISYWTDVRWNNLINSSNL